MKWLSDNNALEINTKKREEIVFGSPSDSHKVPILIHNEKMKQVFSYKHLAVTIDHLLLWKDHIGFVGKKTKQRIYFLHLLRSFWASKQILVLFFYFCDDEYSTVL